MTPFSNGPTPHTWQTSTESRLALKCASTNDDFESPFVACASSSLDPTVTFSQRSLRVARSASTPMFSGVVLSVGRRHLRSLFQAFCYNLTCILASFSLSC